MVSLALMALTPNTHLAMCFGALAFICIGIISHKYEEQTLSFYKDSKVSVCSDKIIQNIKIV